MRRTDRRAVDTVGASMGASAGYVLIGVLLLLLAATGLAYALLAMTRSEYFVSRVRWEMLTRRVAAEAGQNLTARALSGTDSLPQGEWLTIGSASVPPRARYDARVVRLSREIFLIHSEGSLRTEPGRDGRVGLYWAMDPVTRLAAARGILELQGAARVGTESMVDPSRMRDRPAMWPGTSCDRFRPQVDTLFLGGLSPQAGLQEDALAGLDGASGSGEPEMRLPSLGLLDHDALVEGADVRVSGIVSPAPFRRLGRCARASVTNWGAPLDSSDVCAEHRPVVVSEGSLVVDGGQGQGVLMVSGDATLQSAAHYYGLVLVGGDLVLSQGSEIHGLVRVRGTVVLEGRSLIVGSACAVLSGLDSATQLRRLIPVPGSAWPDSR